VRELRQNASAVLRDVKAGGFVTVTEQGNPIARILPYGQSVIDELLTAGFANKPELDFQTYQLPEARAGQLTTAEILADLRGE